MAINFGKNDEATVVDMPVVDTVNVGADLPSVQNSTMVAENTLAEQKKAFELEIRSSGIVDKLTSEIVISNPKTITNFGREATEELAKVSDAILRKYDPTQLDKTSTMVGTLTSIMDEIDIKEITDEEKKGLIANIFGKAKLSVDALLRKYNTIGGKLEAVCRELKTYEKEIEMSNADLAKMYDANMVYYRKLLAYIIAGDDALVEVDNYIHNLENDFEKTQDPSINLELESVKNARDLLEQQVMDLRLADTVALQTLPRIKSMEYTNWNLARKINSSFIITIPMFKSSISQAIIMKQQKMQTKSLEALDAKNKELLDRVTTQSANNMRDSARLAGSSALTTQDIENSWQKLMSGIEDTKKIKEEIAKQREQDKVKLIELNEKYMDQIKVSR